MVEDVWSSSSFRAGKPVKYVKAIKKTSVLGLDCGNNNIHMHIMYDETHTHTHSPPHTPHVVCITWEPKSWGSHINWDGDEGKELGK